jgi:two-component system, chemotaxis family, sensor kinase CheA
MKETPHVANSIPGSPRSLPEAIQRLRGTSAGPDDEIGRIRDFVMSMQANAEDEILALFLIQAGELLGGLASGKVPFLPTAVSDALRLLEEADSLSHSSAAALQPSQNEKAPAQGNPSRLDRASVPTAHQEIVVEELMPPDVDLDLLREFIAEAKEGIESSEAALLRLETDPDHSESVNTVFRAFHTMKGTSAFLGLEAAAAFAHHAESLLSRMRARSCANSTT